MARKIDHVEVLAAEFPNRDGVLKLGGYYFDLALNVESRVNIGNLEGYASFIHLEGLTQDAPAEIPLAKTPDELADRIYQVHRHLGLEDVRMVEVRQGQPSMLVYAHHDDCSFYRPLEVEELRALYSGLYARFSPSERFKFVDKE